MDYEFLRDVTGQVIVKFSMGHETIGHEFTLLIDAEEVIVRANGMSVAFDALEEGRVITMKKACRCAAATIFC